MQVLGEGYADTLAKPPLAACDATTAPQRGALAPPDSRAEYVWLVPGVVYPQVSSGTGGQRRPLEQACRGDLRSPLRREVAHRPALPLRRDRARRLHALQRIAEGRAGGERAPQLFGREALRVRLYPGLV